jgi:3-hydroxy acid dehydrogenase / malonic semialdehyde reductase
MAQADSPHVVFITGASAGFGVAIARRFIREGARVILAARRQSRLEELARELGEQALSLPLDVSDREAVLRATSELPEPFREVSVLVNNAGCALGMELAHQASLDDWDTMVDTNIKGLLYLTRSLLPGMVARNRGHIINMGSVAGSYPYVGGNVYGATKAFMEMFSLNLRADLAGKNIRVTNIEPGLCSETEFSLVRFKGDEARARGVYEGFSPITAEDIAETVSWSVNLPPHVNVNRLELMPVMQAFAGFSVTRSPGGGR